MNNRKEKVEQLIKDNSDNVSNIRSFILMLSYMTDSELEKYYNDFYDSDNSIFPKETDIILQ